MLTVGKQVMGAEIILASVEDVRQLAHDGFFQIIRVVVQTLGDDERFVESFLGLLVFFHPVISRTYVAQG